MAQSIGGRFILGRPSAQPMAQPIAGDDGGDDDDAQSRRRRHRRSLSATATPPKAVGGDDGDDDDDDASSFFWKLSGVSGGRGSRNGPGWTPGKRSGDRFRAGLVGRRHRKRRRPLDDDTAEGRWLNCNDWRCIYTLKLCLGLSGAVIRLSMLTRVARARANALGPNVRPLARTSKRAE